MKTYYFYDARRQFVSLTFSPDKFRDDARHVLVWVYENEQKDNVVLTRHHRRGWEMPGGKVEPGETPEEAAVRELFEETGGRAVHVRQLAQYVIEPLDGSEAIVKNIYEATVSEWTNIPSGFETLERGRFPIHVMPFRTGMSVFMHDNIFPLCRQAMLS